MKRKMGGQGGWKGGKKDSKVSGCLKKPYEHLLFTDFIYIHMKEFNWSFPTRGIVLQEDKLKAPSRCRTPLFQLLIKGVPQTTRATVIALRFPWAFDGKSVLFKTLHTDHRTQTRQSTSFLMASFIVLEGSFFSGFWRGKSQQESYPVVNPLVQRCYDCPGSN